MFMIKAVFIDIDDTLLDFGKCSEYAMRESYRDFGIKFSKFMFPVFAEINAELWRRLEKGEITKNEIYGKRWGIILAEFGITHIDGNEFESRFQKHICDSAEKVDGAEEILKYLSSKYKIYAASNGPHQQQIKRLRSAELLHYFTDVFTSELLGFQKPDKAFFDACLSKTDGIKSAESVLIGDSLTADILGGINCGMKTVWFNKNNRAASDDIIPDRTAKALDEIKNII